MGPLGHRRKRGGVSIMEVAVTIAVLGILAMLAIGLTRDTIPSWRTRSAAAGFASVVQLGRALAMADGHEYRIVIAEADGDLNGDSSSVAAYTLEQGNLGSGSTDWDILPVDGGGADVAEGTFTLSPGGDEELPGVSIVPTEPPVVLVFGPRGFLSNPDTDFDANGQIDVVFVNKTARLAGLSDERVVHVSRSGMVRVEHRAPNFATSPTGVGAATRVEGSSGSGYAGGSVD